MTLPRGGALLAAWALAAGCASGGSGGGADAPSSQAKDVAPAPDGDEAQGICGLGLGEPCYVDEQCESGICFISEYAPFGVCTVACKQAPSFCETEQGEIVDGAWCVSFPEDDFRVFNHPELRRFCVRTCTTLADCTAIDPAYEHCGDILYKRNPLFPGDPKSVCQAPSATGKEPVDPFTCEGWSDKNPFGWNEKSLCEDYCAFLGQCQVYEPGHNLDCCAWYCFNSLTHDRKSKAEKEAAKDLLTNYVLSFKSLSGSALQCTQPVKDYGPPPIPDANAPVPVAGKCR